MLKLIINGIDFTIDSNLDSISTLIGLNTSTESFNLETGGISIELKDEAASYIKFQFIDECKYPPKVLPVKIITDEGDFSFNLLPKNVSWNTDCTAEITLSSDSNEELCFNRLNNTRVLNDDFWNWVINNRKWKITPYSRDVSVFSMFAIQALKIVSLVASLLLPSEFRRTINWALYGTGRWYVTIKVTDILEYYANKCGKQFSSTILQTDPYNRMRILPAVNGPGMYYIYDNLTLDDTDIYNIEMTVKEFLDTLNNLFFAEWIITPTHILLEPAEKRIETAINVGKLNPIEKFTIKPINHNCAKLDLTYASDFSEPAGDSEKDLYTHIEDLLIDNRALTELCQYQVNTAVAVNSRGRSANRVVSWFRSETNFELGDFAAFMGRELMIANNLSSFPKFIIEWPLTINERIVLQDYIEYDDFRLANPQLSFNREIPGNLYDRFHYKRNPANGFFHCLEIDTLAICFDSDILNAMRDTFRMGKIAFIESNFGKMYFRSAEVIFGTGQQIILQDVKIYQ